MIEATAALQEGRRIIDAAREAGRRFGCSEGWQWGARCRAGGRRIRTRVRGYRPSPRVEATGSTSRASSPISGTSPVRPSTLSTRLAWSSTRRTRRSRSTFLSTSSASVTGSSSASAWAGIRSPSPRAHLPLADLLLTKLQIVRMNPKDQSDIFALLTDHEVADHDVDVINGRYIAVSAPLTVACSGPSPRISRAR